MHQRHAVAATGNGNAQPCEAAGRKGSFYARGKRCADVGH
jgi:hypothetical protein